MAKIIYEDNRIYIKSIIKKVEILPSEINKITSNEIDCIVTLYMKDSEVLQLADSKLADTAYDYCLKVKEFFVNKSVSCSLIFIVIFWVMNV